MIWYLERLCDGYYKKKKKRVTLKDFKLVNNTYGGAVISVRTQVKTLSPCLFALEMDKLTRSIEK